MKSIMSLDKISNKSFGIKWYLPLFVSRSIDLLYPLTGIIQLSNL